MKKCLKILNVLIILFTIAFAFNPKIYATTTEFDYATEISADWTKNGDSNIVNPTKNVMGTAISVIRVVGTGIAIIMMTYVAIKYMSAAPSEKADFKKSATAMIVGAVVLFATTNILSIISKFATTNIK